MTSSTTTVSAGEVKRFAEEKARELGLTELLHMESWAHPNQGRGPRPEPLCALRNRQLHLQISKERVRSTF